MENIKKEELEKLVGIDKVNIFFGNKECIDIVAQFSSDNLSFLSAHEDFMLGIMLGYNRIEQCRRYLNKINLYEHLKVCHFAPEQSVKSMFQMFNNIEYLSCDIKPGRAMYVQDITNITFEDNSFDIVFCSHVLEHVPDDIKAMKELKRILKDNGYAIIVVPLYDRHSINGKYKGEKLLTTYEDFSITDPEKRSIEFGQWDHVRKYEKNDFINRLKISGFNVIEENLYDKLNKNITKKYGIYNNDIIFCCIKK